MPDTTASSGTERDTPNTKDGQEKVEPKRTKPKAESPAKPHTTREIEVHPEPTEEHTPIKSKIFAKVAEKIQEIRDAPNGGKNIAFTRDDRKQFDKTLEGAGFKPDDIVLLDNAEVINLVEEVINGRIKGAVVEIESSEKAEGQNPLEKLINKRAIDSGEENLTVGGIRSRLLPGNDGNYYAIAGGALFDPIPGLPGSPTVTDPILRTFVQEAERWGAKADAFTAAGVTRAPRGQEEFLNQLLEIERALDKAVLEGRLDPSTDPQIDIVRDALDAAIDTKVHEFSEEKIRQSEIAQGAIDLNEHFGDSFKNTRGYLQARDSVAIKTIMQRAKDEFTAIISTPGFDPTDDTTWPSGDVKMVFEVARALNQEVDRLGGREKINAFLDPTAQAMLYEFTTTDGRRNIMRRLNDFYTNIYINLSDKRREEIAGDIEVNAQTAGSSISQGWSELNPRMKRLFDTAFGDPTKLRGSIGKLREWRGLYSIAGVEKNVIFSQLTVPPSNPEETPLAVTKLLAAIEPSGLSVHDLQPTLSAAFGMLTRIDQNTPDGRAMHKELKDQLEAFKFKITLFITAHQSTMDPEKLGHVFLSEMEGMKEETFAAMIAKFGRDAKARKFYIESGHGGHPEEVNLFDIGKRLYSERLRDDRILMNMVEEMTKYGIDGPFGGETLGKIKKAVGYDYLTPAQQAKWDTDLETTRQWLLRKYTSLGGTDWANEKDLKDGLTKDTVKAWYQQKTLHGAFGHADHHGLDEVAEELKELYRTVKPDGTLETDVEVKARLMGMWGHEITWFDVRRSEMQQRIKRELQGMNLKFDPIVRYVDGVTTSLKDVDVDYLMESGYISALDGNVFDLTWIFEWSTYEFIHIYGRTPGKFKDDYKALVHTASTDGYYAKIIDHNWEYMHEDFEDRGRGKGEDANLIFKQYFPGKHNWVFGHVSMATRFIDKFVDARGKALIAARTAELVGEYNFHNHKYEEDFENYMKGVAVRELIVAGAISFADRRYSEVVNTKGVFNKFNPVDNADDRKRLKDFIGAGQFQAYLSNPDGTKYQAMIQKDKIFPSTRDPRLFPWQEFGLKAHWNLVHNWNKKLFNEADITNKQMENFVDEFVAEGSLEKEQGEKFKRNNLGIAPGFLGRGAFRALRAIFWDENKQKGQMEGRKKGWALLILFILFNPIKELFKSAFNEAKKQ